MGKLWHIQATVRRFHKHIDQHYVQRIKNHICIFSWCSTLVSLKEKCWIFFYISGKPILTFPLFIYVCRENKLSVSFHPVLGRNISFYRIYRIEYKWWLTVDFKIKCFSHQIYLLNIKTITFVMWMNKTGLFFKKQTLSFSDDLQINYWSINPQNYRQIKRLWKS